MRMPDFVVIGAMKAGTTTLFRWLDSHPGTSMPVVKEPHFFSGSEYRPDLTGYAQHFDGVPAALRTGEASPGYSDPDVPNVAGRILADLPAAKLVFLTREPEARLRSHYLHELQRSRERRPFHEAVTPSSTYVRRSLYLTCLRPFLPAAERLLVVDIEDLFGPVDAAWERVQEHLDLDRVERPTLHANETMSKRPFSGPTLRLWEAGLLPRASWLPAPLRSAAATVLLGSRSRWRRQVQETMADPLPVGIRELLDRDSADLEAVLGRRLAWRSDGFDETS